MKFNKISNTDLNVSEICLGTMTWGSMQNTEQDGFEQMDYAFSKGINFFDTAELYSISCITKNTIKHNIKVP